MDFDRPNLKEQTDLGYFMSVVMSPSSSNRWEEEGSVQEYSAPPLISDNEIEVETGRVGDQSYPSVDQYHIDKRFVVTICCLITPMGKLVELCSIGAPPYH